MSSGISGFSGFALATGAALALGGGAGLAVGFVTGFATGCGGGAVCASACAAAGGAAPGLLQATAKSRTVSCEKGRTAMDLRQCGGSGKISEIGPFSARLRAVVKPRAAA